jgi:hypothetical protein
MKLRYIFLTYISLSIIFIFFNIYKGENLDEEILIHSSPNTWEVLSLSENDSTKIVELNSILSEQYNGVFFLNKKTFNDYFAILYSSEKKNTFFVSELKQNTIDILYELQISHHRNEKIFYQGKYLYIITGENIFILDIDTKNIIKTYSGYNPNGVVTRYENGLAFINKKNELIYLDPNIEYCMVVLSKDHEFCGMCSDNTLLIYDKKDKVSTIIDLDGEPLFSLGSHSYEVLDYHNDKVLMTMYPKSSSAGGFLDIEIQTLYGIPYTITYSHAPFILDMKTKSICSLSISTWNYKDHHFMTD